MLTARLATAAVLLPLFAGALLFLPNAHWGLFLLAGLLAGALEWAALAGYRHNGRWLFGGVVVFSGLALLYVSRHDAGSAIAAAAQLHAFVYWTSAAFWFVVAPAWLAGKWRIRNALITGVTGWIVLVPAWLALTALQTEPARLLMLLGIVWVADSAAYGVGWRFGRRRLAPRISPGKTWEGVIGASIAVAVYYVVVWFIFTQQRALLHAPGGIILFAVVTVMSVQGDLFESWMKRQAGVKDSGKLFPGHGGMLDRIDGLTASVPLAALWLYYFNSSTLA